MKSHPEECLAAHTNSSPLSQCDGISERLADAMSVGIPPFLTLSEKPSTLRDKSGTLQNPDRFALSKIRHWNSISIKPPFLNENSYDYCSRKS
jgi:hypothetical protein